ncbi:D-alanine--D-alanine ligase family protein [uncultured Bifidobacterium sp.]|uniref:D-alanine--D-alanine ligase family protein n=1 Tax=uncultured Bifidobacterium sp. TaxID=165187 RepID=UPI002601D41C|nr:D-alanine--D-alanine ligase family protein [uncultured Bifidobacterium sp.]
MVRKRVAVLYGGRADEHSISCVSTAGVLGAMDPQRFDPVPIGITKDGQWITGGEDPRDFRLDAGSLPTVSRTSSSRDVILDPSLGCDGFLGRNADGTLDSLGHIDVVFPVLHGPYGEDGTVQGLLEMMSVPYVGCGVFASAACMDKHYTKLILQAAGIPVAEGITVDMRGVCSEGEPPADGVEGIMARIDRAGLTYPLFVKPSRAGSSFGVTRVDSADGDALAAALVEAFHHDWRVLVEQGVEGREIECAVLAEHPGDEPSVSWPGEIVLDRHDDDEQFYDFDSKYTDAQASHVEVPAHLPQDVLDRVRDVAARAFVAVDGAGLSRVDTFVTPDGRVVVNEINTMPGFTPISMYPQAWAATGVDYGELVGRLIEGASR